ncbi:MAG: hypothetical protein QW767_00665 [Thermoprotei archaeon]
MDSNQLQNSTGKIKTGIEKLDSLLNEITFAEFYGEWDCVNLLAHRFLAENGGGAVLTQEFGGINTYLLSKINRNIGKSHSIQLVRAFGLDSTLEALNKSLSSDFETVAVIDPFHYAPKKWFIYSDLTKITAAIRRLGQTKLVAVFNRSSQFSKLIPEGGTFHHSSIPAIIKVEKGRLEIVARILKHPALESRTVRFSYAEAYGLDKRWSEQRLISEWL